jgi:hypothetical protein
MHKKTYSKISQVCDREQIRLVPCILLYRITRIKIQEKDKSETRSNQKKIVGVLEGGKTCTRANHNDGGSRVWRHTEIRVFGNVHWNPIAHLFPPQNYYHYHH